MVAKRRDEIRLWRDAALGAAGVDLLAGRCLDHRYKPHFHEEVVVAAFTAGAQWHRVGRHSGVAGPGSVLIIPAGETHTGEAAQDDGWSYRAFYPDTRTLAEIGADLCVGPSREKVSFDTAPLHEDAALAHRLAALHRSIETNARDPLLRQQAFAAAMYAVLLRYARPVRAPRRAHRERTAIRRAIDHAHEHFTDPELGIADLAAAAGLSPYHFMRCFRAATGVTAHGFVVQLRIWSARRMLAEGLPAAEVAHATGFADQSHMIRHFRMALGVTPGQYARDTLRRTRFGG
jgi:AraC-like DNA-binding protein